MCAYSIHRFRAVVLALLAAIASGIAFADTHGGKSSPAARYEVDRAMCLQGQTSQDRSTCLREAAAAFAQAKRGDGDDAQDQFEANRLQRCEPLPAEQRADCIARMHGEGSSSGSVAGGGIYRELVTNVQADDQTGAKSANH